jgi:hypothetical protein
MFNMFNRKPSADFTVISTSRKSEPAPPKKGETIISRSMTADEKKEMYIQLSEYHADAVEMLGYPNAKVEYKTLWQDIQTRNYSVNVYGNQFRENFFFEILKINDDKSAYIPQDDRYLYQLDPTCIYWEKYTLANVKQPDNKEIKENLLFSVPIEDLIPVALNGKLINRSPNNRVAQAMKKIDDDPIDVFEKDTTFEAANTEAQIPLFSDDDFDSLMKDEFKAEDQHYSNLSVLDLLAIIQCEPISSKQYLNEAINTINKKRK